MYTLSLSFRVLGMTVGQLYSVSSTSKMMKDPLLDLMSHSDHAIAPSESQEDAIRYLDDNSTRLNGGALSEAIPTSSSNLRPESPSKSSVVNSESGSVDEQSSGDSDDGSGDSDESDSGRWPPKVCQSPSPTRWQLDNMFPGSEHRIP